MSVLDASSLVPKSVNLLATSELVALPVKFPTKLPPSVVKDFALTSPVE